MVDSEALTMLLDQHIIEDISLPNYSNIPDHTAGSDIAYFHEYGRRNGLKQFIDDVEAGNPDFEVILVYDISRWGRFQDADESAYYEHICQRPREFVAVWQLDAIQVSY